MPLIRLDTGARSGAFVEDRFFFVPDGKAYPEEKGAIVTLARFQGEKDNLLAHRALIGVRLAAGDNPAVLKNDLPRLAAVVLEFPKFRDGRPFSWARMLRTRYDYRGEIRASGDFLPDQLFFMVRTGFDSFEVRQDFSLVDFDRALNEVSLAYQPSADGRKTIRELRAAR
ncbi:MAG: DUF934 domain-containing protein [Alphaproteobacteria bacterium]|nr:DUF934 domain-containing protein [Alphaproteobacteria bacterium]MBV9695006.1 DUF934 domain-containing protein [Alphaproteobacteria bacterium]